MKKAYRHGEIALVKIDKLPKGIEKSDSKVLMSGSHGNSHTIDNGIFYPKTDDQYIFGYLEAKNTNLLHSEHGNSKKGLLKSAKIEDGFYELRKQHEHTPQGLSPVID